jgi:hypothetical protein
MLEVLKGSAALHISNIIHIAAGSTSGTGLC